MQTNVFPALNCSRLVLIALGSTLSILLSRFKNLYSSIPMRMQFPNLAADNNPSDIIIIQPKPTNHMAQINSFTSAGGEIFSYLFIISKRKWLRINTHKLKKIIEE